MHPLLAHLDTRLTAGACTDLTRAVPTKRDEVVTSSLEPVQPLAEHDSSTAPGVHRIETPAEARRRPRVLRRVLLGVGWTIAVLLAIALVLYVFGGPGGATPQVRAEYDEMVRTGAALAVEDQLVIPIPGCTCHSDDALLLMQHSERRIRDCFGGCH